MSWSPLVYVERAWSAVDNAVMSWSHVMRLASRRDLCRERGVLVTLLVCATAQARFWNGHQHRRKTNKLLLAHCVGPLQACFRAVPGSGLGHLKLGHLKYAHAPT